MEDGGNGWKGWGERGMKKVGRWWRGLDGWRGRRRKRKKVKEEEKDKRGRGGRIKGIEEEGEGEGDGLSIFIITLITLHISNYYYGYYKSIKTNNLEEKKLY